MSYIEAVADLLNNSVQFASRFRRICGKLSMTAISVASRQFTIPVDALFRCRSTASTAARWLPGDRCRWNPIDYGRAARFARTGGVEPPSDSSQSRRDPARDLSQQV